MTSKQNINIYIYIYKQFRFSCNTIGLARSVYVNEPERILDFPDYILGVNMLKRLYGYTAALSKDNVTGYIYTHELSRLCCRGNSIVTYGTKIT